MNPVYIVLMAITGTVNQQEFQQQYEARMRAKADSNAYFERFYPDLPREDQRYLDSLLFAEQTKDERYITLTQRRIIRASFKNCKPILKTRKRY